MKKLKKILPAIYVVSLCFLIFVISCDKSEKQVAIWNDEEKFIEPVIEKRQIVYEKTEFVSDNQTSYWFVLVKKKNTSTMMNTFIKQDHSYFSQKEALSELGDPSKLFLVDFKEISEATFINANTK